MRRLFLTLLLASACQAQSWYNASWSHRKAKPVVYRTAQTGFPVLVDLSGDADLLSHARGDRHDILFTSSDGTTKLPHERVGTTDQYYVKTDLSATLDTALFAYAGNPSAADQSNLAAVWDSHFKMVSHCEGGVCADSTSNANDATTPTGTPTAVVGQIGSAVHFDGFSYLSGTGNLGNPSTKY